MDQPTASNTSTSDNQTPSSVMANLQSEIDQLQKQTQVDESQVAQSLHPPQTEPSEEELRQLLAAEEGKALNGVGSRDKEREHQVSSSTPEKVMYQEVQTEFEPPAELEKWMEKVPNPQTVTLPKPVKDEYGDILIQATNIPRPKIILPLDEMTVNKALHQRISDSIRWLGEWCKRTILLYPGRVFFQKKN